jgi:hypothetical protein
VINSSLVMSEAPLLAFTLAGLALLRPSGVSTSGGYESFSKLILSALLFGVAGLIRPMACFAAFGAIVALLRARRFIPALVITIIAGLVAATGLLFLRHRLGGATESLRVYRDSPRAYGGELFTWPFHSLLRTPGEDHASVGTIVYIWAHVLLVITACVRLARRALSRSASTPFLDNVCAPWLIANLLFVLCIGGVWGFRHFPRFTIPAQPALFWALRDWLPRKKWIWLLMACGLFVFAVFGVRSTP